jgi:hypothetical protein
LEAQGYVVLSTNNQLRLWSTAGFLDKRCLGPEGFARFDGVPDRGFERRRWVSYDFTTHDSKERSSGAHRPKWACPEAYMNYPRPQICTCTAKLGNFCSLPSFYLFGFISFGI